ncbi:MAG: hypothetical protein ACK56I_25395, partial [bacterium]
MSVKKPSSHGKLIKVALAVNYTKDIAWLSHNNAIHQTHLLKFSGFNPFHCGLVMAALDALSISLLCLHKKILS